MPEATAGLMLYPRGFYGAVARPAIEKQPRPFAGKVARLQNNLNFLQGLRPGTKLEINENVEELFQQMLGREHSLDDFEFRKKIYTVALTAFGTFQFDYWYSQQKYSPAAGELHRDFLQDTLRFIETGERGLPPETWNNLIGYTDRGERKGVLDTGAMEFFGISGNGVNRIPRNGDLRDVLCQWIGHPTGLHDLLYTLHILFGIQ